MKRKVNLLVVFLLIANLMLCVTMLPKAQAGDKLPPDLIKFTNDNFQTFCVYCKKYECKQMEIKCAKSILNKADKLNGITDKYRVIYSYAIKVSSEYKEVADIALFVKKNGAWSVPKPSSQFEFNPNTVDPPDSQVACEMRLSY